MKAERGKLFIHDTEWDKTSTKNDGIGWHRWNSYVLEEVEKVIKDPQQALDTFHEYGKHKRSSDYEARLSAVECARKIVGVDERPMATLVRT